MSLFGIKKSIVTDMQRNINAAYTAEYEDISKINYTAMLANKIATLATADSDFDIPIENNRAELLRNAGFSVWNKIKNIIARSLGTGGVLIVPYVQNSNIYFDVVTQDRLSVNKKSGNDIINATILADSVVVDNIRYFRFVTYNIENGNLTISNRVTTEYGRSATVEQWKDIQDIAISNVERMPFGYIKSPIDNRRSNDNYGVPITYGCNKIIKEIEDCLEQYKDEFKLKEVRIRVDERDLRDRNGEKQLTSKLFLKGHNNANDKNMFDVFDPAIRENSYHTRLTDLYELLEKAVGLSRGALTEPNTTYENSQKIREAVGSTWSIIYDIRKSAEKGMNDFLYACDVLANYYELSPPGEYFPKFDWDCSMIESTTETWKQLKDSQSIGIRSKAELRAWQTGESLEDAQKAVDEITAKEPGITSLLGMSE